MLTFAKDGAAVYPFLFPARSGLKSYNFYLFRQGDSLTLIDAGIETEECWQFFLQGMAQHGFSLRDLTRIILTHNHHDHAGLVNRITAEHEVPVYAHPDAIYRLKRDPRYFSLRIDFFRNLYQALGCGAAGERQVEQLQQAAKANEQKKIHAEILPLKESDPIAGMRVIETPGHAPDHLIYWDEQRKWLFAGDHLIGHISSNALIEPDREGRRILSLLKYAESLQTCLEIEAEWIWPGHGEPFADHKPLIAKRLKRIEEKADRLLALVERGLTTASELAQAYYPHKYESEFSLVMSEILGHLDYLEKQKKVRREEKGGIWRYYPAWKADGQQTASFRC